MNNFRGNVYVLQDNHVLYESVAGFADLVNEVAKKGLRSILKHFPGNEETACVISSIRPLIPFADMRRKSTSGNAVDWGRSQIDRPVSS